MSSRSIGCEPHVLHKASKQSQMYISTVHVWSNWLADAFNCSLEMCSFDHIQQFLSTLRLIAFLLDSINFERLKIANPKRRFTLGVEVNSKACKVLLIKISFM